MKEKIRTKISTLRIRKKIDSKTFIIYLDDLKDKEFNPLGYSLSIEPKHRCIFINGRYRYLAEKDFEKLIRDLDKIIKFHKNKERGKDEKK